MALSNLNKEVTTNLFKMLLNDDDNKINMIKQNHVTYSKLSIIAEQIYNLQSKAMEIIDDCSLNEFLNSIETKIKKVPGTYYYHYKMNNRDILSIISPEEWRTYDSFNGKYYYNYDYVFYKC